MIELKNKLKQLKNKHHEILTNLSEEELKQYIQVLSKNYYIHYLNNETELYNNTVKQLEEVLTVFKIKYSGLNNYINFCLLESVNKLLNENIASDVELTVLGNAEDYFSDNPFQDLINAFHESRQLYFKEKEAVERIEELELELARYKGS